jgi:serine phosphatase RsbU (regulator of sigma subunit)
MFAGRVLICEDEGLTALRLRRALAALGCDVVGMARNGEEGVRLACRFRPDLILMDVNMPELDGIEATRRIMAAAPAAVVMLTAYSDPDLVRRAVAAGASAYLVKPLDEAQLWPTLSLARARFDQLQRERQVAASLAESYLGQLVPVPGFQVARCYAPAAETARVGGDFFDLFELPAKRFGVVIGDVCGSGLAAAGYTTMARHTLRAYSVEDPSPAGALTRLNRALYGQMSETCLFLSMFYGVLDLRAGRLIYGNAGHPPPFLCDPASGRCEELNPTGTVVAAIPEMEYGEARAAVPPGSLLALFTDGVTEARAAGELFGSEGIRAVILEHRISYAWRASAETIAQAILDRARQFAGGYLKDDAAVLVLRHD